MATTLNKVIRVHQEHRIDLRKPYKIIYQKRRGCINHPTDRFFTEY